MPIGLQDVIVTLIAAFALLLVAWRLIRVAGSNERTPACSNCSSCVPVGREAASSRPQGSPTPVIWLSQEKPR